SVPAWQRSKLCRRRFLIFASATSRVTISTTPPSMYCARICASFFPKNCDGSLNVFWTSKGKPRAKRAFVFLELSPIRILRPPNDRPRESQFDQSHFGQTTGFNRGQNFQSHSGYRAGGIASGV